MIRGICEDVLRRVYDFSDMTDEELRCKFFQKLQECIELCNNTSEIVEWLKNEGLEEEVNEMLSIWKDDGTLDNIINEQIFYDLNSKIDTVESNFNTTVDNAIDNVNTAVDNAITNIDNKFNTLKADVDEKLQTIMYVKNEEELVQAVEIAKTKPIIIYIYKDIKLNNTIFIPGNTEVKGLGNITITASESINCCFSNYSTNATVYNGTKNIRIENLIFDGENRTSALTMIAIGHAENITITNCRFKNLHVWHMIELNAVNNGRIENCSFENYGNSGTSGTEVIQLDAMINESCFPWFGNYDNTACKFIQIRNNKFNNVGTSCIGNHSFASGVVTRDVFIVGNHFENCVNCITLKDVNNISANNNKAYKCAMFINLDTASNSCFNIDISNNYFQGLFISTIEGIAGENRFVTISPAGKTGSLEVKKVTINNNIIENCATHGIGILCNDVVISNNIFSQIYKNAIYHWGGWNATICNNSGYYVGVEGNDKGFINVGGNSSETSKSIMINGNNVGNGARIIINSNIMHCCVSNNIATIVDNSGVGTVIKSDNIDPVQQ